MKSKNGRRSPIKDLPVRVPGQSTRERIDTLLDESIFPWLTSAIVSIVFAGMEWINYLFHQPRAPVQYTIVAVLVTLFAALRIRKHLIYGKNLRLGRTGEEAVGQYLEEKLRPKGCQVLHDIPADGFNVDHVIIGPKGIFSVETKTHSKPAKGASSVKYDGEHVTVNGFTPDRDPVVQARAEARFLGDLIETSTGRRFPVRPIVLYPGWFVEKMPENSEVWVLNEKVLPTFIQNARSRLVAEDINLITYHLKRYVIAKTREERAGGS